MSEAVFGVDAKLHPITHMPLEAGKGALSADRQAMIQCDVIEQQQGKAAGDEMREKVRAWIAGEHEAIEHPTEEDQIDGD